MRPGRAAVAVLAVPVAIGVTGRLLGASLGRAFRTRRGSRSRPAPQGLGSPRGALGPVPPDALDASRPAAELPVGGAVRAGRIALVAVGVAGLLTGAWLLVTTVAPKGLLGLLVWLAAAVVLHDAILSPVLFGIGWMVRLSGRRAPLAALAVVQAAAIAGAIGSLLLLPPIRAKQIGVRNPTVLPLDYTANLVGMWVVLAVLAVLGVTLVLILQPRRPGEALPL